MTSVPCLPSTKLPRQSMKKLRLPILLRLRLMERISTTPFSRLSNFFSLLETMPSLSWLTFRQQTTKRLSSTTSVLIASHSPLSSLRSAAWASPSPLRPSRSSTSLTSSQSSLRSLTSPSKLREVLSLVLAPPVPPMSLLSRLPSVVSSPSTPGQI